MLNLKDYITQNGINCALNEKGELLLTNESNRTFTYISAERFVNLIPTTPMEPNTKDRLKNFPELIENKPDPRPTKPSPLPTTHKKTETSPVWTMTELEKKTRSQLQALAKKHDIPANKTSEYLRNALSGTVK